MATVVVNHNGLLTCGPQRVTLRDETTRGVDDILPPVGVVAGVNQLSSLTLTTQTCKSNSSTIRPLHLTQDSRKALVRQLTPYELLKGGSGGHIFFLTTDLTWINFKAISIMLLYVNFDQNWWRCCLKQMVRERLTDGDKSQWHTTVMSKVNQL